MSEGARPTLEPLDHKESRKRKREALLIVFLSLLFIALTIAEFRLTKLSNTLPFVNSIFFFGLLNVNIIILLALMWLVFRNIGKLFIERRRRVLGARLKTKLVIAFLAFSVIPTLMLFVISATYINSSFDKWFSLKVQNTLQASLEITRTYYRNTEQTAMHFAEHIATGVGRRLGRIAPHDPLLVSESPPAWIAGHIAAQRELLALDAVEFYRDPLEERVLSGRPASDESPGVFPRLSLDLLERAFSGEKVPIIQHVGTGDLIRCLAPIRPDGGQVIGVLVVSAYIPVSLVNKVDEIASVFDDYKDTNPLKYPMKTTYLVILIMITLVIIFVAIWVGLYMARELTVPVERLVQGARAVGAGNLDVSVSVTGHDEISVLVSSFNKMTRDLRDNRKRLTEASEDLERRRLQLEAVLANIGAGVIAIDSAGKITTFNPAAARILQVNAGDAVARHYAKVLNDGATPIAEIVSRAFAAPLGPLNKDSFNSEVTQVTLKIGENPRTVSAVATPLRETENHWGVVAVIDDITHLIKGQREMAWREVARRIAHEIKNPLTPIKLSAQRLQRRLGHYRGTEGDLLQECTETIVKHTDELKEMVNEFSNFARLPEASPALHDLNGALGEVVALYQQAHPNIQFKTCFEGKLPKFEFDREQIKRVAINLLENAVAALNSLSPGAPKTISVVTHYNEQLEIAVVEVADNGPGMSEEVKERVFEPYFSTKTEGTGLGLAIAKRIVNDHDGFIRVHSAPGEGTRFLLELPASARDGSAKKM